MAITVKKLEDGKFLVNTGVVLADGVTPVCDICVLRDGVLKTFYDKTSVHTVPPILIKLGPVALSQISKMEIREIWKSAPNS